MPLPNGFAKDAHNICACWCAKRRLSTMFTVSGKKTIKSCISQEKSYEQTLAQIEKVRTPKLVSDKALDLHKM
ncbi:hypothetical protein NUACC26_099230 [Scytonema sp. NUACC26]